ncbi:MAG: molybdate ABC transporter permease subunit [Epsilonproteobacteria bacterium]|nr:molybdate ABC transporter permease subunit [Campylobacterota bacterium]
MDFTPFVVSFKLSFLTTVILLVISVPLAFVMANYQGKFKTIIESVFSLPIVLPPTVLGYYLLITLGWANLAFSFVGILIASVIYSFPFMFNPILAAIEHFDRSLIEASYSLKKTKIQTLIRVIIPNIKPVLFSASVIAFGHTMGEFGVVLMVGGNIDGVTKVASIAIYECTETLDYHLANVYSIIMLIFSFIILLSVNLINKRLSKDMR